VQVRHVISLGGWNDNVYLSGDQVSFPMMAMHAELKTIPMVVQRASRDHEIYVKLRVRPSAETPNVPSSAQDGRFPQ
jgi:hypothetical protein